MTPLSHPQLKREETGFSVPTAKYLAILGLALLTGFPELISGLP